MAQLIVCVINKIRATWRRCTAHGQKEIPHQDEGPYTQFKPQKTSLLGLDKGSSTPWFEQNKKKKKKMV